MSAKATHPAGAPRGGPDLAVETRPPAAEDPWALVRAAQARGCGGDGHGHVEHPLGAGGALGRAGGRLLAAPEDGLHRLARPLQVHPERRKSLRG
jgi:hypothetical protein